VWRRGSARKVRCVRESGLWVVCAIVILAICDMDSPGVVHLDFFVIVPYCSRMEGEGHLFLFHLLSFQILGDKFLLSVGIIVRNVHMVSRLPLLDCSSPSKTSVLG
jgi:hypothetical protein